MKLTLPDWPPATQARAIRIAAVLVFLLLAISSALIVQANMARMHPPPLPDRYHLLSPVRWGPVTLPSRSWQIVWQGWLLRLFTPACYCAALWSSGSLFAHMGDRDAFPPALGKGLKQVGIWLIIGAVPSFIAVPDMAMTFFRANGKRLHVFGAAKAAAELQLSNCVVGFVLALIGVVLLWAATGGQKLRGKIDEFV